LKENLRNEVVGSAAIKVHQAESSRERADHGKMDNLCTFAFKGPLFQLSFITCIAN